MNSVLKREDGLPSEGWNVGRYIVGLTDNISGNIDNYNLMFLPERGENPNHYYFEITPKVISHIDFEIEGGALRYNGASQKRKNKSVVYRKRRIVRLRRHNFLLR